ncbi:MAG: hypothetical protein CM15mP74_30450 [Halieaceae bacterium]|nr:MAG: hypothetical protein CM15mP74_30450 [Halieaceae bacterium]
MVWTYVAFMESGEDCGVWGTRTTRQTLCRISSLVPSAPSLMIALISIRSGRHLLQEDALGIFRDGATVALCLASGGHSDHYRWFHQWLHPRHGGRFLVAGYRTIVPEECVADKHESYHFANLTDLAIKYADVLGVSEVLDWLSQQG